jgi:hypothetical protein
LRTLPLLAAGSAQCALLALALALALLEES